MSDEVEYDAPEVLDEVRRESAAQRFKRDVIRSWREEPEEEQAPELTEEDLDAVIAAAPYVGAVPGDTRAVLPPLIGDEPLSRSLCKQMARPCDATLCRYHLSHDYDNRRHGPHPGPESCALDVADAGEHTLEECGNLLGLTRERVRQIEEQLLVKLRKRPVLREAYGMAPLSLLLVRRW